MSSVIFQEDLQLHLLNGQPIFEWHPAYETFATQSISSADALKYGDVAIKASSSLSS